MGSHLQVCQVSIFYKGQFPFKVLHYGIIFSNPSFKPWCHQYAGIKDSCFGVPLPREVDDSSVLCPWLARSSLLYESSLGILSRGLATFRSYPGDEVQWQNKKKPWLWLSAFPRMPRFFQQLLRIMLTSLRRRTLSGSDFIFWQLLEMKTWTNPAEG